MLKQIPSSGDWVDPDHITSVSSEFLGNASYGNVAVVINLKTGARLVVNCKRDGHGEGGYIQANPIRDEIASWIT